MRRYLIQLLSLLCLLLVLAGCSMHARQMRQTAKYSKQNVKRHRGSSSFDALLGGPVEIDRNDVNFKNPTKIRHRCLYINKKGKRCGRKGSKKNRYKYCFWHTPESPY
ncbi:MAG: hypothetical protein LBF55_02980 [Prevotellaceae bacterium]|jgi:hypothetical protein|nr:hypothetical protein [Prevotellaceae bacterium]